MSPYRSYQCFCLLLLSAVAWSAPVAQAQLVPDVTLGDESSSISTDQLVQSDLADVIEGGAARGSNLFHSFSEFNVNDGQRVYFANPAEIESILSRVTGNNPSEIFGTLGVDGPADLFLINPNGLIFGENAQLDIPGSFYGTTAEAVELGNGVFSATAPEQSQLLAISPSVSFWNYLTENSGNITNRGALAVEGDLVLAASQLDLESQVAAVGNVSLLATDAIKIRDTADIPFIAFAGEDLLVQGNQQVDIIALSHPDSGLFSYGDMVLRSADRVGGDTHYFSGGNFRVENLDGSGGELFSPIDPIIRTYGDVLIQAYVGSSLHILAGGSIRLGTAIIGETEVGDLGVDFLQETITLSNETTIEIDGSAQATVDIRAGIKPDAIGIPPIEIRTGFDNNIDRFFGRTSFQAMAPGTEILIGDILLLSPNGLVFLTNNYFPNQSLPEGDIVITGTGILEDGINASSFRGNVGGSVYLDSRSNISIINSIIDTSSSGLAGDIVLLAGGTVFFENINKTSGVGAFSFLDENQIGKGGNIRIQAENLEILNGATLDSSSRGIGNAGDIVLDIRETILFAGRNPIDNRPNRAISAVSPDAEGQSGEIKIAAKNFEVLDGSQLSAAVFSTGNASDIILEVSETTRLEGFGGGIFSNIQAEGRGRGGNIRINTESLEVLGGAQISTGIFGAGVGGEIVVNADETVRFGGFGFLPGIGFSASGAYSSIEGIRSTGRGQSGDIRVTARNLEVLNGAQLSSSTDGIGNAGDIVLDISETTRIDGNDIPLFAVSGVFSDVGERAEGKGGDISLSTRNLELLNGGQIRTSTFGIGNAGDVTVEVNEMAKLEDVRRFFINPSAILSNVQGNALGNGGNIKIGAMNFSIRDRGLISANTVGPGNAGAVSLRIQETLSVNDGTIASNAVLSTGGQIQIDAGTILLFGDSDIQTFVNSGADNGGDITITADAVVALDDSDILAFAADGRGGNVDLRRTAFFGQDFSLAPFGTDPRTLDGNDRVDINATGRLASGNILLPDVSFIQNTLTELPDNLVNPETLVSNSCIARSSDTASSFTLTGSDGLPSDSPQPSYSLSTVQPTPETTELGQDTPVIEPHRVYQLSDGRLVMSRECNEMD